MKECPILFSGPMVRAILDGRKTQTRRVVKLPKKWSGYDLRVGSRLLPDGRESEDAPFVASPETGDWMADIPCPYGKPGDRLWVRETWFYDHIDFYQVGRGYSKPDAFDPDFFYFRADGECCQQVPECCCGEVGSPWKPSIHMPRWASRITLEITGVRVERLNEISEDDARAEGIEKVSDPRGDAWKSYETYPDGSEHPHSAVPNRFAVTSFRELWESINGAGSWDANPWVWVVEFQRVEVPA